MGIPGLPARNAINAGRTGSGRNRAGNGGVGLSGRARAGRGSRACKLAGLPEFDHVLEAAEQADEAGLDQGLNRRDHPGPGGMGGGFRAQIDQHGGDGAGQGRGGLI